MRLVLDTNVVAAALLWGGTPRLLLQAGREKRADLFTSVDLLAELTNILARRKFEKKIAACGLTVDQIIDRYAALAPLARPVAAARIAPNPDGDVLIGTAIAANADLFVTGDKSLLSVGNVDGLRIVRVGKALATDGNGVKLRHCRLGKQLGKPH